ncbi:ATP-binding protein [Nocardioides sp. SR21]|uniref:sensor histidine kinase n=1 Tax=Nocardioides sp. SR21 TaxID=2919501 RepID=UPI001FAAE874|nr:GAF domain-containing sensor histidine kinase [Nocardioides sp. SR21]
MTTPSPHAARAAEIDRYGVLTEPPRADLMAIAEIAAGLAATPKSTINLITDTEQFQVATYGFTGGVSPCEDSMCAVVLDAGEPIVLPDASQDDRFRNNPFVNGDIDDIKFYATHQLTTPNGVVIGTLCVFDNEVRELSAAQEHALVGLADRVVDLLELELRTRELKRSNEQLAAFAGQVSHDLRNPLTAVSMALKTIDDELEEAPEPDADLAFLVRRAIGGADRMESLIRDLLAFARVGGELRRLPVDFNAVLADVRVDLATALAGATLVADDLPKVTGDPVQLRAVLQNLIANAAKFTRPGEPAHIEISADDLGDRWLIEVCDRGPGVPVDQRERVFQPLARVDDSIDGSGIGLTTCRRIVEAHGGRIGLAEAPGGGTCAWFELPA